MEDRWPGRHRQGPQGELSVTVSEPISVAVEEQQILVTRPNDGAATVPCTACRAV